VNKLQPAALLGLGLGLAFQTAPVCAWWQAYSHNIPYGPTTAIGSYPTNPWIPSYGPNLLALWDFLAPLASLGGAPFWQYPTMAYGPTTFWSSAMSNGGLYVQHNEVPAGYQIRVTSGQPEFTGIDISVQGGFLIIRGHSAFGAGNPMQMRQSGWMIHSILLPVDANVAAMQMQRGDGVVEIFIPRGR